MKYLYFEVENFKGIEKIKLELNKSPEQKVFTLVGLNESGKTTILEAINFFSYGSEKMEPVKLDNYAVNNYHALIPMSKRDNFNGKVKVTVSVQPNATDEKVIKKYAMDELGFKSLSNVGDFRISQEYTFKDSAYVSNLSLWTINLRGRKPNQKSEKSINPQADTDNWKKLIGCIGKMCRELYTFQTFCLIFQIGYIWTLLKKIKISINFTVLSCRTFLIHWVPMRILKRTFYLERKVVSRMIKRI